MNIKLLLSQYSNLLLQNPLHVLVMAIVERAGLAPEDELPHLLKAPERDVKSALSDLYQNRCVEFSRHSVRLTKTGKQIVDRFGLADAIVDSLLGDLDTPAEERELLRRVLLEYRNDAYEQFQNSVSTQLCWGRLSSSLGGRKKSEQQTGKFVLLLRDIRNWLVHNPKAALGMKSADAEWLLLLRDVGSLESTGIPVGDTARTWLSHLMKWQPESVAELDRLKVDSVLHHLLVFDTYQRIEARNTWFDDLYDVSLLSNKQQELSWGTWVSAVKGQMEYVDWADAKLWRLLGGETWWQGYARSQSALQRVLEVFVESSSLQDVAEACESSVEQIRKQVFLLKERATSLLDLDSSNEERVDDGDSPPSSQRH